MELKFIGELVKSFSARQSERLDSDRGRTAFSKKYNSPRTGTRPDCSAVLTERARESPHARHLRSHSPSIVIWKAAAASMSDRHYSATRSLRRWGNRTHLE